MGLEEELELTKLLDGYGMRTVHRLKQRKVTDWIKGHPETGEACSYWLQKNRSLPRARLTFEVDVFAWKPGHWAALAIEDKSQNGLQKTLDIWNGTVSIRSQNGKKYEKSTLNFISQCHGARCIGKAYSIANHLNIKVLPVGVVDYSIVVNGIPAKWSYSNGVFFVERDHFPEFVEGFLREDSWIVEAANHFPQPMN
jgi:hypothetical protein